MIRRLLYRMRQFRNALFSLDKQILEEKLDGQLNEAQIALFRQMQPAEQAHAIAITRRLESAGYRDADLITAALLHDVGKTMHRLSIFDRVIIVIGKKLAPKVIRKWADGPKNFIRLPFTVAFYHAEWGAELARQAGASPKTVELIRHHHGPKPSGMSEDMKERLAVLKKVDEEN